MQTTKFNDVLVKILLILVSLDWIDAFLIFIYYNLGQSSNIDSKLITLGVSKFDKSKEVKDEQP